MGAKALDEDDVVRLKRLKGAGLALVISITASIAIFAGASAAPAAQALSSLSDADKAAILQAHNDLRQQYGVAALAWDDNLAAFAQDWANQLAASGTFQHRDPNQYGENLWAGTAGAYMPVDAVTSWASEVQNYDVNANTCANGQQCGHFTQIVWSTTARVGCGLATGNGLDVMVCNYDLPGNVVGQSPFANPQAVIGRSERGQRRIAVLSSLIAPVQFWPDGLAIQGTPFPFVGLQ